MDQCINLQHQHTFEGFLRHWRRSVDVVSLADIQGKVLQWRVAGICIFMYLSTYLLLNVRLLHQYLKYCYHQTPQWIQIWRRLPIWLPHWDKNHQRDLTTINKIMFFSECMIKVCMNGWERWNKNKTQ